MSNLLLTYYGDDFTGSTDVMESLVLGGVPAILFLEPPDAAFIAERFPHVRAVGVAGVSRSMTPVQMDAELPQQFEALRALNAPVFHYKICSTFDSAPEIGSIGYAVDIGWQIFQPRVVPLMVGAPALRRYVVFGNLFAGFGDEVYRLDRHPTMRQHPITPMHEADLQLHLGKQTARRVAGLDVLALAGDDAAIAARVEALMKEGAELLLLDILDETHLPKIGRLLWSLTGGAPAFVVGSSGVEYALTRHWQARGLVDAPAPLPSPGAVEQLLVVSGSAAPQSAAQITWALERGFEPIRLDSARLVNPDTADAERENAVVAALDSLGAGRSPLLFSAHGPDDPAIVATNAHLEALGLEPKSVGARLGAQQGVILREVLTRSGLRRACVVGGDTCGHAARQLGIYALEIIIPVAPGAPLCRARSHNPQFDGLEISLKGGQNGKPDYFGKILKGSSELLGISR
jgi:uncharacterized protein YgbK (DUF1537 family)